MGKMSKYSNHILNTGHAYWSTTNTMKIIKIEKKRKTSEDTGKITYTCIKLVKMDYK
jgi:hypothetical protein